MAQEAYRKQTKAIKDKVLIYDVDPAFRDQMRKALETDFPDVEVLETDRAEEAWSRILGGDITVTLAAAHTAELPAMELLHRLNLHKLSTRVIVTSDPAGAKEVVDHIKAGAFDFMEKPFPPEDLKKDVTEILEKIAQDRIEIAEAGEVSNVVDIIGKSASIKPVKNLIEQVAPTNSTVLITGESGTGKEVAARSLHKLSKRKDQQFVIVDCGTIPAGLVESELFGYVAGSFTGADNDKRGLLEQAHQGTVFFDEVGEFPLDLQVKLLRVLQNGEIRRIGSDKTSKLNMRIVAATNKDLDREVRLGRFRQDLYYRLKVVNIQMPPLRERTEDIELFVEFFLNKYRQDYDHTIQGITKAAMAMFKNYDWPGNVRELEHTMLQIMALHNRKKVVEERDLPMFLERRSHERKRRFLENAMELKLSLDDYTREFIRMFESEYTEKELAATLGITPKTLWQKRRKWGIPRKKNSGSTSTPRQ
ncbi:MAG: sigma-54 dependent transcriptional regulator [bacterium]